MLDAMSGAGRDWVAGHSDAVITTLAELESLYDAPRETSLVKETDRLCPEYRAFVEASPFVVLATRAPEGLDSSPRGDAPGFVRVADQKTLLIPDRPGNNRIDSLRNIVRDPHVGLLFLVPGVGESLRVNGRAVISAGSDLLATFAVNGKPPRTVLIVTVEAVYFQCSRALVRADLWNPAKHVARGTLPSAGDILSALSRRRIDGGAYDRALPERIRSSLY